MKCLNCVVVTEKGAVDLRVDEAGLDIFCTHHTHTIFAFLLES